MNIKPTRVEMKKFMVIEMDVLESRSAAMVKHLQSIAEDERVKNDPQALIRALKMVDLLHNTLDVFMEISTIVEAESLESFK